MGGVGFEGERGETETAIERVAFGPVIDLVGQDGKRNPARKGKAGAIPVVTAELTLRRFRLVPSTKNRPPLESLPKGSVSFVSHTRMSPVCNPVSTPMLNPE